MIPIQIENIVLPEAIRVFDDSQDIQSSVVNYAIRDGGYNLDCRNRRTTKRLSISGVCVDTRDCDECGLGMCEYQMNFRRLRSMGEVWLYAIDPICDKLFKILVVTRDPFIRATGCDSFDFVINMESTMSQWIEVPQSDIYIAQDCNGCLCKQWVKADKIDNCKPRLCNPIFDYFNPVYKPILGDNDTDKDIIDIEKLNNTYTLQNATVTNLCGSGSYSGTPASNIVLNPTAPVDISIYSDGSMVSPFDLFTFDLMVTDVSVLGTLHVALSSSSSNYFYFNNIQDQYNLVSGKCIKVKIPINQFTKFGTPNLNNIGEFAFASNGTSQITVNNLQIERVFGAGDNMQVFTDSITVPNYENQEVQAFFIFETTAKKVIEYGNQSYELPAETKRAYIMDNTLTYYTDTTGVELTKLDTHWENGSSVGISVYTSNNQTVYSYTRTLTITN